jgi:hypothetical protein
MLLVAGLLAFPLASTVAQAVDAGTGDHKVDAKSAEAAMKSTAPGYMNTGEIHGASGKLSENAATGGPEKKTQ